MAGNKNVPQLQAYQFKPGQSGNPGGRNNIPEDIRDARKYNNLQVERLIHSLLEKPVGEIEDKVFNETTNTLEALISSMLLHAIKKGDFQRAEWVLNRAGLKIKDDPHAALQLLLASMPKEDLLALGRQAMSRLSESPDQGHTYDVKSKPGAPDGFNPGGGRN